MKNPQKNPKKDGKQDGSSAVSYEQQILDTSSIGVLITQISSGTILYANKAIADLLGIAEAASLIGKPVPDFYWDPKDRQALLGRFRAEGSITNSETRARRADGSMIWVSISLQPFNFEGVQVLLSEITDISERKRAEEAQRVSEEQFRSIYDNAAIGLYRTTPDGRILMLNPTGVRLMGYDTFEEAAKLNVEKAGYKRENVRSEFREKVESEGYVIDFENEWKRKDGSSIFVRESAKTIRDENGKVLYYDGSFEDITEQKRAVDAVKESQQKLSLLIDASPLAMITWNTNFEVVSWNPAAERVFGYSAEEALGKHARFIIPPEYHQFVDQVWQGLITQTGGERATNGNIAKGGRAITCEWYNTPMAGPDGKVFGVSSQIEDVTERKQAEARLQSMVENAPEAIVVIDLTTGLFVESNENAVKLYGLSHEELVKVGPVDMSPPVQPDGRPSAGKSKEQINAAMQGESPVFEWMHRNARGEDVPCEVRLVRLPGNLPLVRASVTDITERKQAEDAIRESQQKLSLLIETSPLAMIEWNTKFEVVSWNPAAERIFGYSAEEALGKHARFIIPPEYHQFVDQVWQGLITQTGGERATNGNIAKGGRAITCEWYNTPLAGPDGKVFGVSSQIEDVTERKRAESESQRLTSILESSIDMVALADMEARVIYMNRAGRRMVGIGDDEDITTTHIPDFTPQWALETVLNKGVPTAIQEGSWSGEGAMLARDGHEIPVSQAIMVHRAADGTPQNLSTVARDITESKRLEEEMRIASMYARNLIEASLDPLVTISPDGKITDVNNATEQVTGVSRESLIGKEFADYFTEPNRAREGYQQVFSQGTVKDYPLTLRHASGRTMEVLYNASVYKNEAGEVQGVFAAARDVTESKRAEEIIRKNEARLKEAEEVGNVGSWDYDMTIDTLIWSDYTYRIYGRDPETFKVSFDSVVAHYPPGDKEAVLEAFQKTIQNRTELKIEHRIITGNNETRFVFERGRVTYSEDGTPLRMIGSIADITERKRLEEEARVAALYARNLIEASLDPLVTISPDGKITDVNNATEQVTGVSRESLIGKEFADYFTEPGRAREGYQQVFSQGIVKDYPLTLRHASGRTIEVLYNASVYKNEAGEVQGVFAAARDVTESKRLEREIQEAFERRGYQVQVSTEISQEVASATELSDLFSRVVTLTKERLGYYHTQLLRYDTGQDAVVLINGYGETGQKMLASGHKLPMGSGLIGTAAASGQTILRATLAEDPDWQPNPLLPNTQGEIAVPIKLGEQVLGVLDVQSDEAGAITEDDRLLLEGLCGQVAVAIEGTRLRQEMAERLEEVNRLYRSMSREGWKTYRDTADLPTGFMYDQIGISPVNEDVLADELFAKIPMRVLGGEVVGTLTVANDPRHPTSSEDQVFLQQVSDQIALALESARLFEQTQTALAQTEKLFESSRILTQATDLQQLVAVAVETFNIPVINRADLQIFNYNSAGELDSTTIVANWWNGTGTEVVPIGAHFPKEMLPVIKLFLSPVPLFINDTLQDERLDAVTLEILKPMNVHAAAIMPLTVGTHQLGVLILQAEEPHNFTQDETRLFSGLAPQIATVLENRRQFERAQQQADREGALNIISQKIQSATTVEAVLQIAARELGHALGAPMTIAQLSMKDKK